MAVVPYITADMAEHRLNWLDMVAALERGHRIAKPILRDQTIQRGKDTLLSRCAWVGSLGMAVKTVTVMPDNAELGLPTVQGALTLFEDATGEVQAVIDGGLVTKWKTVADSLLGAKLLARPDVKRVLVVGAGTIGCALIEGYRALYPDCEIGIWNRTAEIAVDVAEKYDAEAVTNLAEAVGDADIISVATMSPQPVVSGDWLRPGQHLDLIGAFLPDTREADDEALRKSRIFVDCAETTVDEIGELKIPLATGAIERDDILGDLYDLTRGAFGRKAETDITLYKNGGGAHLDLMAARAILRAWRAR